MSCFVGLEKRGRPDCSDHPRRKGYGGYGTLQLRQCGIDEDTLVSLFGMKAVTLLHQDETHAGTDGDDGEGQADDETGEDIDKHKAKDAHGCSDGRPGDVATLQAHELQGTLKPLEHRVVRV